jgi:hypothetical protein
LRPQELTVNFSQGLFTWLSLVKACALPENTGVKIRDAHTTSLSCIQLLKLGVLYGLPQLSQYYIIWDFDMAPVRPIPLFYGPTTWQHQPEMDSSSALPPLQMAVNIGGARARGYEAAYYTLFGREYGVASDTCWSMLCLLSSECANLASIGMFVAVYCASIS